MFNNILGMSFSCPKLHILMYSFNCVTSILSEIQLFGVIFIPMLLIIFIVHRKSLLQTTQPFALWQYQRQSFVLIIRAHQGETSVLKGLSESRLTFLAPFRPLASDLAYLYNLMYAN